MPLRYGACGFMQVWVDSKRRELLLGIIRFLDLRFSEIRGGLAWDGYAWHVRYALMRDPWTRGGDCSLPDAGSSFELHAPVFSLAAPLFESIGFWYLEAWDGVFRFVSSPTIIGQSTTTGLRQRTGFWHN
jgi:hypothetical protein